MGWSPGEDVEAKPGHPATEVGGVLAQPRAMLGTVFEELENLDR